MSFIAQLNQVFTFLFYIKTVLTKISDDFQDAKSMDNIQILFYWSWLQFQYYWKTHNILKSSHPLPLVTVVSSGFSPIYG